MVTGYEIEARRSTDAASTSSLRTDDQDRIERRQRPSTRRGARRRARRATTTRRRGRTTTTRPALPSASSSCGPRRAAATAIPVDEFRRRSRRSFLTGAAGVVGAGLVLAMGADAVDRRRDPQVLRNTLEAQRDAVEQPLRRAGRAPEYRHRRGDADPGQRTDRHPQRDRPRRLDRPRRGSRRRAARRARHLARSRRCRNETS